jgi:hypothetical protein
VFERWGVPKRKQCRAMPPLDAAAASLEGEPGVACGFPFRIGLSPRRGTGPLHPSAGNLRQVGDPDQSVLACEREGLALLWACDAENLVMAGVVDRDGAAVVDNQPAGIGKNGVSKIILRANSARPAQSDRPPIWSAADRVPAAASDASKCAAMSVQSASSLALSCVLNMSPTIDMPSQCILA